MKKSEIQGDVRILRATIVIWTFVFTCVFAYVIAGPVLNLVYIYQDAEGLSVDNTYGPGWYPVTAFIAINYLLLMISWSVVADPDSSGRVDLHQIACYAGMIGNGILFFVFLFYYWFWINSLFGGYLPFNDPRWCCVYFLNQPQFCPNTIPCVAPNDGLAGSNLLMATEFRLIWIFTLVFFTNSWIQRVFNLTMRRAGAVAGPQDNPTEGVILGYLLNLSNLGFVAYWVGWPLLDTIHIYGYPTLGIPPGPGPLIDRRFTTWQWIALAILFLNYLPPVLFQVALTIRTTQYWHKIHFWTTAIVSIITLFVFFYFVYVLIPIPYFGFCNSFTSAGSICNDYRWCCNYFADAPDYCNNVGTCPNMSILLPNHEFVMHIVICIVFICYNSISLWMNYRMRKYGVFPDPVGI